MSWRLFDSALRRAVYPRTSGSSASPKELVQFIFEDNLGDSCQVPNLLPIRRTPPPGISTLAKISTGYPSNPFVGLRSSVRGFSWKRVNTLGPDGQSLEIGMEQMNNYDYWNKFSTILAIFLGEI